MAGATTPQPAIRGRCSILVRAIAKRESRDVAANLRALEAIKDTPDKLDQAYL